MWWPATGSSSHSLGNTDEHRGRFWISRNGHIHHERCAAVFLFTLKGGALTNANGHWIIQCGAPWIAKLVYNSNNWFMILIIIVSGVYKPSYNWGAPHCMKRLSTISWKIANRWSKENGPPTFPPFSSPFNCSSTLSSIIPTDEVIFFRGVGIPPTSQPSLRKTLYASEHAFAAITHDGGAVTWGDPACGGDSFKVQDQLKTPGTASALGGSGQLS